jgi:acyl-coenzyme A thioesterase PaaI-like protein
VSDDEPRDLEAIREWINARPVTAAFALRCESIEPGRAVFRIDPPADWSNPNGSVAGALILAASDFSAGMAAVSVTGIHDYVATVDLGLHFLRPAHAVPLYTTTRVLRTGGRTVFLHTEITDADGALVATGVGSFSVGRGVGRSYPIGTDL